MNPRTLQLEFAAALVGISLAVMGCTDAFTVHSIVEEPYKPGPPHNMHGLWVNAEEADPDGYMALRIAPVSNPDRSCEVAEIRIWEEPAALDDAPLLEGRACLTEVAGNTVVEISTLTTPVLHLQYLARLRSTELSLCGWQTVWGLSWDLAESDASEAAASEAAASEAGLAGLAGLEYTRREAEKYEQVFLISDGEKLRAYLVANLPRIVEACDEGDGKWESFRRVTPVLVPTEGEDGEEPGDGSPASPPLP